MNMIVYSKDNYAVASCREIKKQLSLGNFVRGNQRHSFSLVVVFKRNIQLIINQVNHIQLRHRSSGVVYLLTTSACMCTSQINCDSKVYGKGPGEYRTISDGFCFSVRNNAAWAKGA